MTFDHMRLPNYYLRLPPYIARLFSLYIVRFPSKWGCLSLFSSLNIELEYLKMQNIISICLLKNEIRFALLPLANWFLTCYDLVPEACCPCCQQCSCLLGLALVQHSPSLFKFIYNLRKVLFRCSAPTLDRVAITEHNEWEAGNRRAGVTMIL